MEPNPRGRAVDDLVSWLASRNVKHTIVGGDFNTFPHSKAIREMGRRYEVRGEKRQKVRRCG